MIFGSKSERFIPVNPSQGSLFALAQVEEQIGQTEQIQYERTKPVKDNPTTSGRKLLAAHLERVEIIIEPKEDVTGLKKIGEEITEELEYKPAVLFVNQYIRP